MPQRNLYYDDSGVIKEYSTDVVVNHYKWAIQTDQKYIHRYWVDTQYHHYLFSGTRSQTRKRACCWAAIIHVTGLREMETDTGVVPVEIAALGKPYLVAYLYSVHKYNFSQIGEKLDLADSTISQYISDVIGQRV